MNSIIEDVDNAAIPELNAVYTCLLHKGHGKDRTKASSYRTISTCPFVSKSLDTYIAEESGQKWNQHEAITQFQGKGSSHDLAALLLTETLQHSLNTLLKPAYILYLDARSAFDLVIRELLITKLYDYGIRDQGLILLKRD